MHKPIKALLGSGQGIERKIGRTLIKRIAKILK
jgi:hypothetical protein